MENRILKLCKDIVNKEEELTCNGINCKECPFEFTSKELCYACEEHRYNEGMEIAIRYIKEHSPIKEEIKTEKTFREVIAGIKEGEVWESKEGINGIVAIKEKDEIVIRDSEDNLIAYIADTWKFKLKRKQCTFSEAFKAYEDGKEIESCVNGELYLKEIDEHNSYKDFSFNQIRSKWYINN